MQPIVIKISGRHLDDHDFLCEFAGTIKMLDTPVVIVHGGGKEITEVQRIKGIRPQYVDGVRLTDVDSLAVVEMVLCGTVNKRLVRYLVEVGLEAIGLSGVDRGIVRAKKMVHPEYDMQYTGSVTSVRGDVILSLLKDGITPVFAPVCLAEDDTTNFNVNADHVTGAIATAINAARVVFITNVEGVMVDNETITQLSIDEAEGLIADGTIFAGMIPKVQTALAVLEGGVSQAAITDLAGLRSHGGTVFIKEKVKGLTNHV